MANGGLTNCQEWQKPASPHPGGAGLGLGAVRAPGAVGRAVQHRDVTSGPPPAQHRHLSRQRQPLVGISGKSFGDTPLHLPIEVVQGLRGGSGAEAVLNLLPMEEEAADVRTYAATPRGQRWHAPVRDEIVLAALKRGAAQRSPEVIGERVRIYFDPADVDVVDKWARKGH